MKKRSILFPLFAFIMNANAQQTALESGSKPASELKKNELSINTAPLLRILLNAGSSDGTRYSIMYKRYLNERSALRFSLVADVINDNGINNSNYNNDVIILSTDSVLIKQKTISSQYVSPHLNIGYERLFGKHKMKWFYGTDLSVGYSIEKSFKQNQTLFRDTTQGPTSWVEVTEYRADIVSKTNTNTFSVGVSPFFGAKYPISKRFSISAQVGVDMAYRNENISVTTGTIKKTYHVSTFDFNERTGFLNDISLVYKF